MELEKGTPVKQSQMTSISPSAVAPEENNFQAKPKSRFSLFYNEQISSLSQINKKQDHLKNYSRLSIVLLLAVAVISFLAAWGGTEISKESHVSKSAILTSNDGHTVATARAYDSGSTYDFLTRGTENIDSFITEDGLHADIYASYKSEKTISFFSHVGTFTVSEDDTFIFEPTSAFQNVIDTHHHTASLLSDNTEDKHGRKLQVGKWKVKRPRTT